ncbi:hypothetical protein CFIO01_01629 [Colletotrichum fioriniae PJ7]|uniref:Uncharacterized protein n=1 Tax=Colletotrichum fioriniae PJ7 TaxID=1445577 RepID=A0A010QQ44_9PEZI|nr:hypothetical protein CFIO01_01629 [Colletotrichum fioriniae PJ7]
MPSQEPHSSEDISDITSQEPTQCNEKRNDDESDQDRPETARNVSGKDQDNTEASSAGSSAQNPPSSSKECVIKRFWGRQISVVVEFETCRDHLVSPWELSKIEFGNPLPHVLQSSAIPSRLHGRGWDVTVPDISAPGGQLSSSLHGLVTPDGSLLCIQNPFEIVTPDRPGCPESFFPRHQNIGP